MPTKRRGFSIVEMIAASALTAMLLTLCVQMLGSAAMQRRSVEKRLFALEEAANITESLGSMDWQSLTPEGVAEYRLSDPARRILGDGQLNIKIEPSSLGPPAKLVRVEITWPTAAGKADGAVRLSSWVYSKAKEPTP